MKKKYISPEIIEVVDFGNPLLDIGTTIPVDTGGSGESQSGAEGKRHNEVLAEWLDGIPAEERRKFTETIFGLLESTGAKTVSDLSLNDPVAFASKAAAMIRQYATLDKDAKDNVYLLMRRLAEANMKAR